MAYGTPLELSPETDSPPGAISPERLNNYGYVNADGSGDPRGLRCPVGAHMRRVNPRDQPVTGQGEPGGSDNTHRLIRRGLPYGPPMILHNPTTASSVGFSATSSTRASGINMSSYWNIG